MNTLCSRAHKWSARGKYVPYCITQVTFNYYIGYTMRHLHERVEEHKHKQSSICKHYMSKHGTIPRDLTENITVLRKCKGKFECFLHEMLFIQKEKPSLNIQSDRMIPQGRNCSCKLSYCIFAPLNFSTEFFLSLDNVDKMSSKRRAISLVSLLFLLSSISKSLLIMILNYQVKHSTP